MGIDTLSAISVISIIAMTGIVIETPNQEPKNLTCSNDDECIDKMEACNVYCHNENPQLGDNKQGKCVGMNYVDNGMYPECE